MRIPDRWTFDAPDVADNFERHVREQLPWYDLVTAGVQHIARHYIQPGGLVYDLGAGTGNVGRAIADILTERGASLYAIEPSEEMVKRYDGPGTVEHARAEDIDFHPFDLAVSLLTLMFVPPAEVPDLLEHMVKAMRPGGAIILVERTLPPAGYMSVVSSRLTLAAKMAAGADSGDILAKELSLAGVQRPIDPRLLEDYGAVEWFRFANFGGYVIEAAA